MAFLSDTEKQALIEQIHQAEQYTYGEIVTVIARQSDGYRFIPLLWASLAALSLPGLVFLYHAMTGPDWTHVTASGSLLEQLYPIQVLVFLGLGALFQIPRLQMMLIPKSVKRHRAARHAREQFFLQNLHLTNHRTGVLVFVSVAEHYVEIIVDKGVADVVDDAVWKQTVDEFVAHVRAGEIAKGFELTVEHCRDVLCKHHPATDGRPDELPNHLIEV